ncbi:MAG: ABC transporter ATP-binding protein [Fimbriimonadaceae bacterium]
MLIDLKGVGKVYRGAVDFRALTDVNLNVDRGEFVAVIGQSGSGKSTLLNIIGMLDRATEGTCLLDGHDTSQQSDRELTRLRGEMVGFIFQFHYLLPDFTVLENVLMPSSVLKAVPSKQDIAEAMGLLERVGIAEHANKLANAISGGQQQRVAIARALARGKPLVLADEPTGNLDSVNSEEVFKLMREFHAEKRTTFMLVTHDERIAERCDRVIRITDGKITEDRKPRTVSSPASP